MCDDQTLEDAERWEARQMSRREAGRLAGAAVVTTMVGSAACASGGSGEPVPAPTAAGLGEAEVTITTPDGRADGFFVHPAEGTHPAVLVWPDAFGMRPAMREIGRRLASEGYAVLVINPYYRSAKGSVLPEGTPASAADFSSIREYYQSLDPEKTVTDAEALVTWLTAQAAVDSARPMGSIGFCMGGSMVMRTAAAKPERVGAGASFHGGGLATDSPTSPHLLIPTMDAEFLIAIAENDDAKRPNEKTTLREAFDAAGLKAEIEVYEDAMHGWVPTDTRVYNEAQSEHAWSRMLALFSRALG